MFPIENMSHEESGAFPMKVDVIDTKYELSEDGTMNINKSEVSDDLVSISTDDLNVSERSMQDNLNSMNVSCKPLTVQELEGHQSPYITVMTRNFGTQHDNVNGESRSPCLIDSSRYQAEYTAATDNKSESVDAEGAQCCIHATTVTGNTYVELESGNLKYESQVLVDSFRQQVGDAGIPDIRNADIDEQLESDKSKIASPMETLSDQHAGVQYINSDIIRTENVQNSVGATTRNLDAELEISNDAELEQGRHAALTGTRINVESVEYQSYGFGMPEQSVSNEIQMSSDVEFDEYDKYPLKDEDQYAFNWEKGSDVPEPCVSTVFSSGDLVWAKVKSHPWWPGQVFNANDASVAAQKIQKSGRLLVAFFGDGTFGWLQESQLIPFKLYFEEKVKQTTTKSFCRAVSEALDEICRRSELSLSCLHYNGFLYSKNTFPDTNAGIQYGVRIRCHRDISVSREEFRPKGMLEFVKAAACFPLYPMNFTLEFSECCGHVYGVRKFFFTSGVSNVFTFKESSEAEEKAMQHDLKRKFSSLEPVSEAENADEKQFKRLQLCEYEVLNDEQKERKESEDDVRNSDVPECRNQPLRFEKEESFFFPDESSVFIENKSVLPEDSFSMGKRLLAFQEIQDYEPKKRPEKLAVRRRPMNKGKDLENYNSFVQFADGDHKNDDISGSATVLLEELVGADDKLLKEKNKTKLSAGFSNTQSKQPTIERNFESSQQNNNSASNETLVFEFKESDNIRRFVKSDMELENQSELLVVLSGSSDKEQGKVLKLKKRTELMDPSEDHKAKKMKKDKIVGQANLMQRLQEVNGKDLAKRMSLSKNVQHVEGRLLKVTENSGREKGISDLGNERSVSSKLITKKAGHSFIQLLHGLQILAVDPLRYASGRFHEVASAFLRYRNFVFLKSAGYGSADIGMTSKPKVVKKSWTITQNTKTGKPMLNLKDSFHEPDEVKMQHRPQNAIQKSEKLGLQNASSSINPEQKCLTKKVTVQSQKHGLQKVSVHNADGRKAATSNFNSLSLRPGLQELATAARRKKLEVEQAMAAAKKVDQSSGSALKKVDQSSGSALNKISVSDLKHDSKSMKQYNFSKDASSSLYRKSPVHKATDAKTTETSHGLFIQFPPGFAMPSEAELNEVYSRFGTLEAAGIRLYSKNSSATVVFRHSQDAETALKHSLENKLFGTDVSFKLRIFAQSQKAPTHRDAYGSKHASTSKDDQGISLVAENAGKNHTKNASSSSMPVAFPRSNEQVHVRSANSTTPDTNSPNVTSVSTVNVLPSCDIKDQMMKLLHEVSFIISSIYLNPEATWPG